MAKNLLIVSNQSAYDRRKGDRRFNVKPFVLPASLMTHMMVDLKAQIKSPMANSQPINEPINAYHQGAKITQKRVPAGWQQAFSA